MPDFAKCTDPSCWFLNVKMPAPRGPHCHPVKPVSHLRLVESPQTLFIAAIQLEIMEKDDRTSPAEYPDMVLLKPEEIEVYLLEAIAFGRGGPR